MYNGIKMTLRLIMSEPEVSSVTVHRRSKYFSLKEAVESPESFRKLQERLAERILLIPQVEAIRLKYTFHIVEKNPTVEERLDAFFDGVTLSAVKVVKAKPFVAIAPKFSPKQLPVAKPIPKEPGPDLSLAERAQQAKLSLRNVREAREVETSSSRPESPVSAVSMDSASGPESPASCSRSDSRMSLSETE